MDENVPVKFNEELIKVRLKNHDTPEYSFKAIKQKLHPKVRLASVLVPLSLEGGEVYILLTQRAAHMSRHGGEVAFPGGMQDHPEEDEVTTCLREADEEISLPPSEVELVSTIPPRATRHGIIFTTIVGLIPNEFKGELSEEVDAIFRLPLSRFLSSEGYSYRKFNNGIETFNVHSFEDVVDGKTFITFGLTANICIEIAIAAYQRKPMFSYEEGSLDINSPFKHQELYLEKRIGLSKL